MYMTTTENLFWAMNYNGRDEEIERLYWDMKELVDTGFFEEDYAAFHRPDYIDCDDIEVFWMVFVQNFGEYGTSPRYGWFSKLEEPEEAVEWLRVNIEKTWNQDLTLVGTPKERMVD